MKKALTKENLPLLCLMAVTAVLITVLGIAFKQDFFRMLPLYNSLIVGLLQSRANRYANLIGSFNSILYMFVHLYLHLYATALYCLLFSFPVQLITFILWSKHKYAQSTVFRKLTQKARIGLAFLYAVSLCVVLIVLNTVDSRHQVLDALSTLTGILVSFLSMFAFVEYTWLMLPSGVLGIALPIATMTTNPEQITYVVYAVYSMICVTFQFFRVRKLYAEQQIKQPDA